MAEAQHNLRSKRLSHEQSDALLREYRRLADEHGAQSPAAIHVRNRIIEANAGLCFAVWRRGFQRKIDHAEVLGIGCQGLIDAIERFDCSRGFHFSTYAMWWVRHAFSRTHANEAGLVRVPVHVRGKTRAKQECVEAAQAAARMGSLDARMYGDDDPATLKDRLADEAPSALERLADIQECEALRGALANLSESQRAVLDLRATGATLKDVEARLGVSRDRALQLHGQALGTLRRALEAA